MKEFLMSNRLASIYIVIITIAWCVIFYKYLKLRDICNKNKSHYDLTTTRFELEPREDNNLFNIYCNGKQVDSFKFTDVDYDLDRHLFFKFYITWLEKEFKK